MKVKYTDGAGGITIGEAEDTLVILIKNGMKRIKYVDSFNILSIINSIQVFSMKIKLKIIRRKVIKKES